MLVATRVIYIDRFGPAMQCLVNWTEQSRAILEDIPSEVTFVWARDIDLQSSPFLESRQVLG